MPMPFDATLKDLVTRHPGDYGAGFHLRGPGVPVVLNADLALVSAATDVVLAFGDPPRELVDLNFQSGSDDFLVSRLLLYNALLHHRYGVPVHSLLILLRPAADGPHLTGKHRYLGQRGRGRIEFRYEIVRLWQVSTKRLLRSGLGIVPLAVLGRLPHGMRTEPALAGVIRHIQQRVEREAPAQARQVFTSAFFLSGLRVSEEASVRLFQGVQLVEESTTYQYVLRQGGIRAAREILLDTGQDCFGKPDETTLAAINGITDLDRLKRLVRRLRRVTSWEELLRGR